MKKLSAILFLSFAMLNILPQTTQAQCKRFTKKKCLSKLPPYTYNGQLNSAILSQGDVADLKLTFYPEQKYRVFVCADEGLGNIEFKLINEDGNVIYDNENTDYLPYWDFSTNEAIELTLRIIIPPAPSDALTVKDGCVSILVGFKDKDK